MSIGDSKNDIIKTIIIICVIIGLLYLIMNFISNSTTWKIIRLRTKLIIEKNEKILNINYQILENPETQNLVEKAGNAINNSNVGFEGIYRYGNEFFQNSINVIIASSIMVIINPFLILIIIIVVLTKFLLTNRMNKIDKVKFWDVLPPFRRKLSYINSVSRNVDVAKDLRIYNMDSFITKKQEELQKQIH